MTATAYAGNTTKVHWAGANSDVDTHLEIYQGEVDSLFGYNAIFLGLSTQRSVADRSNTYRIDRLSSSKVKGRTSGVKLDPQKVTNDKLVITVDTVLYIRNPIDYQDDWTAPDWLREIGQDNGVAFAHKFDEAHLIQLVKSRTWVAPAHLKPAFSDGTEVQCSQIASPATQADREANAVALKAAHLVGVNTLIKRYVPLTDMVTLVDVDTYAKLLEHPKLLNLEVAGGASDGDYNGRRVVRLNGIPVVECTEFPTQVYDNANPHELGPQFAFSSADLACKMVTFSKSKSLVTVEAKPFTSRVWDDEENFCNVLDCYAMYTVGQRRPDTVIVTKLV